MECLLRYASLFLTLDACCWRYCLFPEPCLKTLKFLNSPSAQTARIFTRLSQWFYTGNNQRLNNRHLRSDELFAGGPRNTLLPFQSGVDYHATTFCPATTYTPRRMPRTLLLPFCRFNIRTSRPSIEYKPKVPSSGLSTVNSP